MASPRSNHQPCKNLGKFFLSCSLFPVVDLQECGHWSLGNERRKSHKQIINCGCLKILLGTRQHYLVSSYLIMPTERGVGNTTA